MQKKKKGRKDTPIRYVVEHVYSGTDDELCRHFKRPDRHIKWEECLHRAVMQLPTPDTG